MTGARARSWLVAVALMAALAGVLAVWPTGARAAIPAPPSSWVLLCSSWLWLVDQPSDPDAEVSGQSCESAPGIETATHYRWVYACTGGHEAEDYGGMTSLSAWDPWAPGARGHPLLDYGPPPCDWWADGPSGELFLGAGLEVWHDPDFVPGTPGGSGVTPEQFEAWARVITACLLVLLFGTGISHGRGLGS